MATNPLSVLRTRMVMQEGPASRSVLSVLRGLLREEGVRSLFTRGLVPSLLNVSHGAAQFIFYEHIKGVLREWKASNGRKAKLVSKT